jgi:hypothetical protein
LRALPQLLDRENLRPHFGTTRLSQRQRQELEQHINELIRQRENLLPPPEGHKRGGYIKKKMMNNGGRVEPVSPSPSVNDQSKPVTPVKPINNPDAPGFKDILNRERDVLKQILSDSQVADKIRGSAVRPTSGGGSADIKQMMNPRNITYRKGGDVSLDTMRYELIRKL